MTKHRVTRRLLAVALSVLLVLGCVAPAVAATYESGTYTGTGTGRNGSVALTLTLTNGAIASVDNVTHSETARYWEKAKVLLDRLVGLQTPEQVEKLDAVTGATLSSNAIKEAAKDVFRQAESKETPVFASGSGTKSDPYLIRTAAQLQAFAAAVNGGTGYEGQYISLDADLDLTGTAWTPIGATGLFNGSFNGNYHTITGMTIGSESEKASYTEAGLFGSVGKGAAIRNVGVINAAIYNKTTTDPSVGLLAAGISENSIVESCWATGTIYSDTTSPYYSYVGGLVGSIGIKSLICNSWTNVVVYAKGSSDSFVGGIVGDTGQQLRRCELRGPRLRGKLRQHLHDVRRGRRCGLQLRRGLCQLFLQPHPYGRRVLRRRRGCAGRRCRRFSVGSVCGLQLLFQQGREADLL